MKKTLLTALIAVFVLGIAGTAMAAPVDFSGDFRFQARMIDDKISATPANNFKKNFEEFRARLNFSTKIDEDTTFFGRFSVRNYQGLGAEVRNTNEFDHFGVKMAVGDWKFSIGRQALTVGAGAILDIGSDATGATNFFDGVVASTKMGNVDVRAFGGKNNANLMSSNGQPFGNTINPVNEWYGVELSSQLSSSFNGGLAYVHKKPETAYTLVDPTATLAAINYWAINGSYAVTPSFALSGEYVKSNRSTDNSGFFVAGTYSWDKDSFTVQYNHVKANAVDLMNGGLAGGVYAFKGADITNAYKGLTYAYSHPITKVLSFHAIYMDLTAINGGAANPGHDKEFATGLAWKF